MQKIKIEYFTDPPCCWSWAMESAWRWLSYEFRDAIVNQFMIELFPDIDWKVTEESDSIKPYEAYWGGCTDQEKIVYTESPHQKQQYADTLA